MGIAFNIQMRNGGTFYLLNNIIFYAKAGQNAQTRPSWKAKNEQECTNALDVLLPSLHLRLNFIQEQDGPALHRV